MKQTNKVIYFNSYKHNTVEDKWKSIAVTVLFTLIIGGLFVLSRVITPPDVSLSERRPLEKMPAFTLSTVQSGEFMSGFEKYAADSFPFREEFRALKSYSVFNLFFLSDKSGLYIGESGAGKFERINRDSMIQAAGKIRKMAESIEGANIYYSIIPDKSIYAGRKYPGFDPAEAETILSRELSGLKFIDLTAVLSPDMFYRTDVHWSQPRISDVVETLTKAMGVSVANGFTDNTAGNFKGVYAGQLALPLHDDIMSYLTNGILDNAEVLMLDEQTFELEPGIMYNLEAFAGNDPYNFFLGGPQPLIVINNPASVNERELYIFRDSFGSSLAPLLVPSYSKVTLIDLRYLDSRLLSDFVTFKEGADILFLYSSQILNNSSVLLVN